MCVCGKIGSGGLGVVFFWKKVGFGIFEKFIKIILHFTIHNDIFLQNMTSIEFKNNQP